MIIRSLNIIGGANYLKRKRISSIIKKAKADVFLIQETKITSMAEGTAKSFWNFPDV